MKVQFVHTEISVTCRALTNVLWVCMPNEDRLQMNVQKPSCGANSKMNKPVE